MIREGVKGWTCGRVEGWKGWKGGGLEGWRGGGTEFGAYDKGRAEGTTRDEPGATQNCPNRLSGANEKMPLNSRTCQPDRCREAGPRRGARGKDKQERGRQEGTSRGGGEQRLPRMEFWHTI